MIRAPLCTILTTVATSLLAVSSLAEYSIKINVKPGWRDGVSTLAVMPVLGPAEAKNDVIERHLVRNLARGNSFRLLQPDRFRQVLFEVGASQDRATAEQVLLALDQLNPDAVVTAWVKSAGSTAEGAVVVGGPSIAVAFPVESSFGGISIEIRRRSDNALLVLASGTGESDWDDCDEVIGKIVTKIFQQLPKEEARQPVHSGVFVAATVMSQRGTALVIETESGKRYIVESQVTCSDLQVGSKVLVRTEGDELVTKLESGAICRLTSPSPGM